LKTKMPFVQKTPVKRKNTISVERKYREDPIPSYKGVR